MGDRRRFDLFASFIAARVPTTARIADVAAGKGTLSFALLERGFRHVVPFEPRPRRGGQVYRLGMYVRDFTADLAKGFDVLVGMHPDSATDHILAGAAHEGTTAIVCPCCVRPSAWTYWGNHGSHRQWQQHLVRESTLRGLRLNRSSLPMTGANAVLFGGPIFSGQGHLRIRMPPERPAA